jgi:hypothetical protein
LLLTLILVFLVIERPSHQVWAVIAFSAMLVVLGLIWLALGRIGRGKREKEPVGLDLGARPDSANFPEAPLVPMRPPKVPEKWSSLVATRPPRDVYLPPKFWKGFLVETLSVLFTIYIYESRAAKHHLSLTQLIKLYQDPASIALLLTYLFSWAVRLKSLLSTRAVVRDGEVTIGYTKDRSWNGATYQFWTQTGETLERRTSVLKSPDAATEISLIPVFYMPEDPRKSVALYGTDFRVRLPEDNRVQLTPKLAQKA